MESVYGNRGAKMGHNEEELSGGVVSVLYMLGNI